MKKALFAALVSLGLAQAAFADSTVGIITSGTSTVGAVATVLGTGWSTQSANVAANASMTANANPVGDDWFISGSNVSTNSTNSVVASVSGNSVGVAPMQGAVGLSLVKGGDPVSNGAFAMGAFTTTSFGAIGSIPAVIPTNTQNLY